MFFGEYTYTIDDKGRISIPPKFRKQLAGGIVVTRGLDSCLFAYSFEEWKKIAEKLGGLPTTQKDARAYGRMMLAGAMDLVPDKQGRIVLPSYLREFADLGEEVVIAGLYNRIEVWDKSKWDTYKKETEQASDEIAEKLAALGI